MFLSRSALPAAAPLVSSVPRDFEGLEGLHQQNITNIRKYSQMGQIMTHYSSRLPDLKC